MDRLKFIDQALHKMGTSGLVPMHMQGAMIVDPATTSNKITPKALARHIGARLRGEPILSKKLVQDPLRLGDIKLIDHPGYDPLDHITFSTLSAPGDQSTLSKALGKFSAQQLDHSRPPWRYEIVDGLENGRLAVFSKLSHATMDGMTSVRVFQRLFDSEPKRLERYASKRQAFAPEPSMAKLLEQALREMSYRLFVSTPKAIYQLSNAAARNIGSPLIRQKNAIRSAEDAVKIALVKPPRTSLNQMITPDERVVAYVNYDFDRMKSVSKALNCTLNDLCLLLVSEGLCRYFDGIGEKIKGNLVLGMPLNTRAAGARDYGNEGAFGKVNVHTTTTDLRERLRAIKRETDQLKRQRAQSEFESTLLESVFDALSPIVIDLLLAVLRAANPWNMLPVQVTAGLSNVPGPRESVYFAGMPLECSIPMVPIFHGGALSAGASSIGNIFSIGFHACGKAVRHEDIHYLVDGVNAAFEQLSSAASPTRSPRRPTQRKAVSTRTKTRAKPKAGRTRRTSRARATVKRKT